MFIPEWLRIKERRSEEISDHNRRMWADPVMRHRFIEARRQAWAAGKYDSHRYKRNTGRHSRKHEQMKRLREQGMTYAAIAERFECSMATVWRCARGGRRVPHALPSVTAAKILRLQQRGLSCSRIAHMLSCSETTVRRRLSLVQR